MINIDSQLKQRMDQFRGRPQDLMQQYQMSRELIDLLALQKLKSEKDAAARSMMMQMQQNPQTIAAQREAELMGRTQQEVAQQVGGIAQLAEARKQQNLQRMASGAQPPVKMAQGGIARFAGPDGSYVNLERLIKEASDKYSQLTPELLRAVIAQESSGDPRATSETGARGLMQLMPATAGDLGVTNPNDLYDPAVNIDAGARYLNQLMRQFGGDTIAALSAYHSGPGRVSRLRDEYGDDYVDQLGPIGQRYAANVLDRIELSPGAQEQLAASVTRMPPPTVTTTVTPEPPRDTARRQTDAFPVGGLDSLREALARSEQQDESESPSSLGERIASRIASEQRVTQIPEYIASAVSGQKAAADAAKDYLARVPGAVADLFSGAADMVPPSVEPAADYLARVPGAVADLFTGAEPSPTTSQPIPGTPADSLEEIDMASLPQRRPPRPAPTPADLRAEEEARVREVLGQEDIMSTYRDMIRRQQELAGRLQDPEQQRRDRLRALLRGMAGRSTFGLTGAGGSAGLASERRRQNALAQQLLDKEFGITREQLGAQLGIGKEALAGGRGVYDAANAMAREVFKANADMALEAAKQAAEGQISQRELVELAAELVPPPTPGEDPEDYKERLRDAVTALGNMTLQLRTTILPLAGSTSPDDFEVQ